MRRARLSPPLLCSRHAWLGAAMSGAAARAGRPGLGAAGLAARLSALGVRAVCFDFDLCVLSIHSFGLKLTPAAVAAREPLEADFYDLPFFRELVPALRAAGLAAWIVSFGRFEVIQAYTDRALGAGSFSRATISTPSCVPGGKDGTSVAGGKAPQLLLCAEQLGLAPGSVFFVDGARGAGAGEGGQRRPCAQRRAANAPSHTSPSLSQTISTTLSRLWRRALRWRGTRRRA